MKKSGRLRMSGLFFGVLCLAVGWVAFAQQKRPVSKPREPQATDIKNYTSWQKANAVPVSMQPIVAASCMPQVALVSPKGSAGPHKGKWINVYVNKVGENAMMTQKTPHFPVGTVIVKQKLPAPNQKPELLTVMLKHSAGYDPQNGDWEFMATDRSGSHIKQRGKIASCQGCHRDYAKTDYIVRSYLPPLVVAALK